MTRSRIPSLKMQSMGGRTSTMADHYQAVLDHTLIQMSEACGANPDQARITTTSLNMRSDTPVREQL